jgi:hypothetical protein
LSRFSPDSLFDSIGDLWLIQLAVFSLQPSVSVSVTVLLRLATGGGGLELLSPCRVLFSVTCYVGVFAGLFLAFCLDVSGLFVVTIRGFLSHLVVNIKQGTLPKKRR